MKVLVLLALVALTAAEAEPEADPQVFVHTGHPFAPVVLKTAEKGATIQTPVVHAVNPVTPFVTLKTEQTPVQAVHVVNPATPVVTLKTGETPTPIVSPYSIIPGYTHGSLPLNYAFNRFPYTMPYTYTNTPFVVAPAVEEAPKKNGESPAVESARKKREADPQLLTHPVVPYVALKVSGEKPAVTTYAAGTIPTVGASTLTTVPVVNVQGQSVVSVQGHGQKAAIPLTYSVPSTLHPFTFPYTPLAYTNVGQPTTFPYTGVPVVYTMAKSDTD